MKSLGVDPGIAGAVAVIEVVDGIDGIAPKLIDVIDIPVLGTAAKIRVDAIGLRNWIDTHHPNFAGVERAGSMPRQGVASAFKYGRAAGTIEAVIACCGIPMVLVAPSKWKRAFHLNPDKEASRSSRSDYSRTRTTCSASSVTTSAPKQCLSPCSLPTTERCHEAPAQI